MLSIAICSFYQTNFLTHLRTNPLSTVTYGYDSEWHDLLTSYDGSPITYDEIGNPLSYRGSTFVWDGRQLTQATKGSETMSYVYGVNGMRLQKTYTTPTKTVTTAHSTDGAVIYADFEQTVENGETTDEYRAYFYDESGSPVGFMFHGQNYYFEKTLQSDISRIYDSEGNVVGEYLYDAWGNLLNADSLTEIAKQNPFRYRGYYFDSETGMYYVSSRYYDPEIGRWINADIPETLTTDFENFAQYNLFAYCFNNPVNMSDEAGTWPKWLSGVLNVVGGALQVAAGVALGATVGWTGFGAVAAGFLIVNGTATAAQGAGQVVNYIENSNILREDNIVRAGVQEVGRAIGGDAGAKIAGGAYDIAAGAASLYAGKVGLQQTGKLPIKVNINKVVNNPLDEFVTIGPADGVIQQYCRTIPQSGYGRIYATQLGNGLYQIANGHHRVAALRALGHKTVKVFLTK